jgi:hypothetical protein
MDIERYNAFYAGSTPQPAVKGRFYRTGYVKIHCPGCGIVNTHGYDLKDKGDPGERLAHCGGKRNCKVRSYYIHR